MKCPSCGKPELEGAHCDWCKKNILEKAQALRTTLNVLHGEIGKIEEQRAARMRRYQ